MAATTMVEETAAGVHELARFLAATSFDDLPRPTVERTSLVVADLIGVAIAGSREPELARLYQRLPEGSGARLLRGAFDEAAPRDAAFANATAASFLELDEGSRPTGHPALHVVPTALAFAQAARRSGRELTTAVALGYEVQARISRSCRLRWPVHPHGTLGHAAATTAIGVLSGWSAEEFERGINGAASLAAATSWTSCTDGATTRNAYAGLSAQAAFTTKLLVESGFTASGAAVADTYGTIVADDFDPRGLVDALGDGFAIERGYFKFHAACALVHSPLEALADALGADAQPGSYPLRVAAVRPSPDEIQRIRVRVIERAGILAGSAQPNQLSAKFSIPFGLAAFVVRGDSAPDAFRGEMLHDERVRELAARVDVEASARLTDRWPDEFPAEVDVVLHDGRVLTGTCSNPYGSGTSPPSLEALRAKFDALVADSLDAGTRCALWEQTLSLETVDALGACDDGCADGGLVWRHELGWNQSALAARRVRAGARAGMRRRALGTAGRGRRLPRNVRQRRLGRSAARLRRRRADHAARDGSERAFGRRRGVDPGPG
jgi:2-methylcitrate dehydratase PrpD